MHFSLLRFWGLVLVCETVNVGRCESGFEKNLKRLHKSLVLTRVAWRRSVLAPQKNATKIRCFSNLCAFFISEGFWKWWDLKPTFLLYGTELKVSVFAVLDGFLPAMEHFRLSRCDQRQIPRQPDLEAGHSAVQQVPDSHRPNPTTAGG